MPRFSGQYTVYAGSSGTESTRIYAEDKHTSEKVLRLSCLPDKLEQLKTEYPELAPLEPSDVFSRVRVVLPEDYNPRERNGYITRAQLKLDDQVLDERVLYEDMGYGGALLTRARAEEMATYYLLRSNAPKDIFGDVFGRE